MPCAARAQTASTHAPAQRQQAERRQRREQLRRERGAEIEVERQSPRPAARQAW